MDTLRVSQEGSSHTLVPLRDELGFTSCLVVEYEGRSRGLALLWNSEVCVSILSFFKNHIHVTIRSQASDSEFWVLTGINDHPEAKNKRKTWKLIRLLEVGPNIA